GHFLYGPLAARGSSHTPCWGARNDAEYRGAARTARPQPVVAGAILAVHFGIHSGPDGDVATIPPTGPRHGGQPRAHLHRLDRVCDGIGGGHHAHLRPISRGP